MISMDIVLSLMGGQHHDLHIRYIKAVKKNIYSNFGDGLLIL